MLLFVKFSFYEVHRIFVNSIIGKKEGLVLLFLSMFNISIITYSNNWNISPQILNSTSTWLSAVEKGRVSNTFDSR